MSERFSSIDMLAKKSLGQHFLTNPRISEKIAACAHIQKGEWVVEVGPGTGALTRALLKEGARVLALEADGRMLPILQDKFSEEIAEKRLIVLHADIRTLTPEEVKAHIPGNPGQYTVLGNIPYYLSGMLFRFFLEAPEPPHTIVFLVQKEVAERIARSKKESLLSLSVKVFGDPRYENTVSRGNFNPPPKVDSAILSIRNVSRERLGHTTSAWFFTLLHAGFQAKRKLLLGNLSHTLPKTLLTELFTSLNIPTNARAEDVPLPLWLALAEATEKHTT